MKSVLVVLLAFFAAVPVLADEKKKAYCACLDARTVLLLGAAMGKSPRSYGINVDTSLTVLVGVIDDWRGRLQVSPGSCSKDAAKDSSVRECRRYMKKYPDGL